MTLLYHKRDEISEMTCYVFMLATETVFSGKLAYSAPFNNPINSAQSFLLINNDWCFLISLQKQRDEAVRNASQNTKTLETHLVDLIHKIDQVNL